MDPRLAPEGVEPELKAYVTSLVSALGGPDSTDPLRRYVLGDEALAVLRDLKRWLQHYDTRLGRWDVARAISETTLVSGDISAILAAWEQQESEAATPGYKSAHEIPLKVAQACLEILVPLTWPLELGADATQNQFEHAPHVARAQRRYKFVLLHHAGHAVLRAVVRMAVKPMQTDPADRTPRDDGVLRLVILLFRNLLRIDAKVDEGEAATRGDIDRAATVAEFSRQHVLDLVLTISAGMGQSFDLQDVAILETLYALLYGVSVEDVYSSSTHESQPVEADKAAPLHKPSHERRGLEELLEEEKRMKAAVFRPSRHSRFGTMVALAVEDTSHLSVSGQRALADEDQTMGHIDDAKKWRRPYRREGENEVEYWNVRVTLDHASKRALQKFSDSFLDAAFNALFAKLRSLLEEESERVSAANYVHYLYLVGWFLRAERLRKHDRGDFALVGAVLNQSSFIVVMKLLRTGHEPGESQSNDLVHAAMLCFRNMLETVDEMGRSADSEWSEAAENIKSRLFYDESWLDLLAHLPRTASKRTLSYNVEAIELSHTVLKMLESYSQQYTYLFVKSKHDRRKRRQPPESVGSDEGSGDETAEATHAEAARVTKERKFDFGRFETKYISESALDAYERLLANYRDVEYVTLKHVLAFMHRIFVKRQVRAIFFRLNMMRQLVRVTAAADGIRHEAIRQGYVKFLNYYTHELIKSLKRTPVLYTELLFSKARAQEYYLDHGYDDVRKVIGSGAKYGAEYRFKDSDLPRERQFAVTVAALLDEGKGEFVDWLLEALRPLVDLQQTSQVQRLLTAEKARLKGLARDALARLLLKLIGLTENGHRWFLSSDLSAIKLLDALELITRYRTETVEFTSGVAHDQLYRSHHIGKARGDEEEVSDEDDVAGDSEQFASANLQPLSAKELEARKLALRQAKAAQSDKSASRGEARQFASKRQKRSSESTSVHAQTAAENQRMYFDDGEPESPTVSGAVSLAATSLSQAASAKRRANLVDDESD